MSQFEFMRNINLGQYLPTDSVLHRLDPRARIVGYSLILSAITFSPHPAGLLLGLVAVLLGVAAARIPLGYALRSLRSPLPFLAILAILQVFLFANPATSPTLFKIWSLSVTHSGILAGVTLLLRFCALILGLGLASYTISTSELTTGLLHLLRPLARLKLPVYDLVMVIQITLRFLPLLAQTAEHIAKAQASRGADWSARGINIFQRARQVLPLLVPLFLQSLHRAENLALAMDARGYGSSDARTSMVELHMTPRDLGVILLAVVLTAAVIIL